MIKQKFAEFHVNSIKTRPLHEQSDEILRECDVRRRIYDRWVSDGKLSWTEANDRLERLLSALRTIIEVETVRDAKRAAADIEEQSRLDAGAKPLPFPAGEGEQKDTLPQNELDAKSACV